VPLGQYAVLRSARLRIAVVTVSSRTLLSGPSIEFARLRHGQRTAPDMRRQMARPAIRISSAPRGAGLRCGIRIHHLRPSSMNSAVACGGPALSRDHGTWPLAHFGARWSLISAFEPSGGSERGESAMGVRPTTDRVHRDQMLCSHDAPLSKSPPRQRPSTHRSQLPVLCSVAGPALRRQRQRQRFWNSEASISRRRNRSQLGTAIHEVRRGASVDEPAS